MRTILPGWDNLTRFDGLTYKYSEPHPPSEKAQKRGESKPVVTLTVTPASGKSFDYAVSPGDETFYREFIDKLSPPIGWSYLGEQEYFCIWQHNSTGEEIFQHAVGGPVLASSLDIFETHCPATAMRRAIELYLPLI